MVTVTVKLSSEVLSHPHFKTSKFQIKIQTNRKASEASPTCLLPGQLQQTQHFKSAFQIWILTTEEHQQSVFRVENPHSQKHPVKPPPSTTTGLQPPMEPGPHCSPQEMHSSAMQRTGEGSREVSPQPASQQGVCNKLVFTSSGKRFSVAVAWGFLEELSYERRVSFSAY